MSLIRARITRPSRTAMQSGRGLIDTWILEYETPTARVPEALNGWVSSGDTLNQVKLKFATREEAEAAARRLALEYDIIEPRERRVRPRNYGDNFKYVAEDKVE